MTEMFPGPTAFFLANQMGGGKREDEREREREEREKTRTRATAGGTCRRWL